MAVCGSSSLWSEAPAFGGGDSVLFLWLKNLGLFLVGNLDEVDFIFFSKCSLRVVLVVPSSASRSSFPSAWWEWQGGIYLFLI